MHPSRRSTRIAALLIGLVLYGVAEGLMVQAAIGISPWSVLAQGIARVSGLEFGLVTILVGLVVLLLWIPLRQRPGVGTVLNVLLVGSAAQVLIWYISTPDNLIAQVAYFASGLLLLAIATGLYVGAGYGPGPRDGLMTGLSRRFGWPIWATRTSIEVSVLIIGWIMGGNVGVGTVVFAALIGPLCHLTIPFFARRPAPPRAHGEAGAAEGAPA